MLRTRVRSVEPGNRRTYCSKLSAKWSSYGRVVSYIAKSPGSSRAIRSSCTTNPLPRFCTLTRK